MEHSVFLFAKPGNLNGSPPWDISGITGKKVTLSPLGLWRLLLLVSRAAFLGKDVEYSSLLNDGRNKPVLGPLNLAGPLAPWPFQLGELLHPFSSWNCPERVFPDPYCCCNFPNFKRVSFSLPKSFLFLKGVHSNPISSRNCSQTVSKRLPARSPESHTMFPYSGMWHVSSRDLAH